MSKMLKKVGLAMLAILMGLAQSANAADERDVRNRIAQGALSFADNCQQCHQLDGYGEEALYPSLRDPALLADGPRLIRTIIDGRTRHLRDDNGIEQLMPSLAFLSDVEIAAIIAFISNSWGDDVLWLTEADVAAARRAPP